MCIEPPRPRQQPSSLPNISAISRVIGDAARERMAVLAIGRDDRVLGLERLHRADRDRLLADVEVQEAADLLRL